MGTSGHAERLLLTQASPVRARRGKGKNRMFHGVFSLALSMYAPRDGHILRLMI